jgi:hypothetical protein
MNEPTRTRQSDSAQTRRLEHGLSDELLRSHRIERRLAATGKEVDPMKTFVLVLLVAFAQAKDVLRVQVAAVHSVTHEDRGSRAIVDKAMLGAHAPTSQSESFNLDAIINGEHVVLACDDPKGCESVALGTYDGELKRNKWVKMTFALPMSQKQVTRWYKIAGRW